VSSKRFLEIITMLKEAEDDASGDLKLCVIAANLTNLDGAGIGLRVNGGDFAILCTSTEIAQSLLATELSVGEGPCTEVCRDDRAVSEGYLDSLAGLHWPIFTPVARDAGVRAVYGFPVDIGAIRIGALVFYSLRAGELDEQQSSDGHLLASVFARAVLAIQAGAPPGSLASELVRSATFDPVIQQAAGMISVQGDMSIGDALVTLRAHGFATGVPSSVLAAQVVARETRFDVILGYWRDDVSAESEELP
jgi:hypothetical protein